MSARYHNSNQDVTQGCRILAVDDHQLVIDGLKVTLCQSIEQVDIVNALTGQEALEILENDQNFNLILLDLVLPDFKGVRLLRRLKQMSLTIPIAILSASENPLDVDVAIAFGASGFVGKATSLPKICQDILAILEGKKVVPDFYKPPQNQPDQIKRTAIHAITPRQLQVLELLAQGLPNKVICRELNLTPDTVKSHLRALFSHLNVQNRTECVRVASDLNLVD